MAPVAIEEDPLQFDPRLTDGNVTTVQWDEQVPGRFAEFEVHTKDHYDFRFDTKGNAPVDLSLKYKNCSCARPYVTLLTPEEASRVNGCLPAAVVLNGAGGFPGLVGCVPTVKGWLQFLDAPDRWQELDDRTGKTVTIPAAPTTGLVRVSWEGRREGREGLVADLWVQQKPKGRVVKRLRVPLNFVPAIQVADGLVAVPDLTAGGQERKVAFNCWSATRPSFPLKVREESGSPCFACEAKPLNAAEWEKLAIENRDRSVGDWPKPSTSPEEREKLTKELTGRVLFGYRVTVTVHERQGEQQLDLGPFRRRIYLQAGPADKEKAVVMLEGMVRGEVTFLNPDDKDRIDLGYFRRPAAPARRCRCERRKKAGNWKSLPGRRPRYR